MNTATAIAAIITALFGAGGVYALLKIRPEAGSIVVKSAQDAVVVQASVIDALENEINRQKALVVELEAVVGELRAHLLEAAGQQAAIERLTFEFDRCEGIRKASGRRLRVLEAELATIRKEPRPKRDRRTQPREEGTT